MRTPIPFFFQLFNQMHDFFNGYSGQYRQRASSRKINFGLDASALAISHHTTLSSRKHISLAFSDMGDSEIFQ
jgi:hypothetical protein